MYIGRVVGFGAGEVVRDAGGVSRRVAVVFALLIALTELLCTLVLVVVLLFLFPVVVMIVDGCSDG